MESVSFDSRQCAICRSPDVPFMQSAAAACICNLAANVNSKETIATSGALEVLVTVLQSENQAAAAQVSVFHLFFFLTSTCPCFQKVGCFLI